MYKRERECLPKTEQCKYLINQIVSECDNEEWLAFTLKFLANLHDKRAVYNGENIVLIQKGGVAI